MMNSANENLATVPPQPRPALSLVSAPRVVSLQDYECFLGVSSNVTELKEFVSVQASQWQPTLLIGERGLRQEKVARALHQASEYWAQPFFAVNAHGLSSDALDALLFGPQGVMETFQHGTIFINELVSLPLLLQQRFAVYLEEQRWRTRATQANQQRLIFSTECNPAEMNASNRIAFGLIEMLRPSSFMLKPLRERSEDIPYLASRLVEGLTLKLNKGAHDISPMAMKMLTEYFWERNIDELEEVLESAIARTAPHQLDESLLPTRIRYATFKSIPASGIDLPQMVDDYERSLIETALSQTNGNQTKASQLLGLRVQTLNMKLKRFAEQQKEN